MNTHLKALINERILPDVLQLNDGSMVQTAEQWAQRRTELLTLLRTHQYGHVPTDKVVVRARQRSVQRNSFAGKADHYSYTLYCHFEDGSLFDFPLELVIPHTAAANQDKPPVLLHIAFRPNLPDQYAPVEEIIDQGFALASICYNDIAPDREDRFTEGLPALFERDPQIGWGKISMWAWAASRVLDFLLTLDQVNASRTAVIGHSRLGKTALWAAAQDERFFMAASNNSGSCGSALQRGKSGERIIDITQRFPYWFCGNFSLYAEREQELPFDQHYLLALIAPRALYIGSAEQDLWADPLSELLTACAVEPVYNLLGADGLIEVDGIPAAGSRYEAGNVAYQLRTGTHYMSRADWQCYMAFFSKQLQS